MVSGDFSSSCNNSLLNRLNSHATKSTNNNLLWKIDTIKEEEEYEDKKFKVLIANDEPMQLEMLAFKFEKTCQVDRAQNGFEAFERVMVKFNEEP